MRSAALVICSSLMTVLVASTEPAAEAAGPRMNGAERAMARSVNHARARRGLHGLRSNRPLARAADYHSWEMLAGGYFAHVSRDGESFSSRVRHFARYRRVGEALAMVTRCRRRGRRLAMHLWMRSPTHRAILLRSRFARIGIGMRVGWLGGRTLCVITADLGSRH
jgi:uncharacterized protein YkwD